MISLPSGNDVETMTVMSSANACAWVLSPAVAAGVPSETVIGSTRLGSLPGRGKEMVPRGGFEPPTRGFSVQACQVLQHSRRVNRVGIPKDFLLIPESHPAMRRR